MRGKQLLVALALAVAACTGLCQNFAFADGNIAKVGETEYATFEEAVTAAGGKDTIVLLSKYTGTYTMTPGQTLIVDKTAGAFNTPTVTGAYVVKSANSGKVYTYTTADATIEITKADGTVTYSDKIGSVAKDNSYKFLADISIGRTTFGGALTKDLGTITFDLNGHTLTSTNTADNYGSFMFHHKGEKGEFVVKNGKISVPNNCYSVFTIREGQTVTLGADLVVEAKGDIVAIFGEGATLNTAANLSTTGNYGIVGNGSAENFGTIINVTGGSIKSAHTAIYHPQDGKLNISGGAIEAESAAVEIRAGELNISGGSLTSTADHFNIVKNGNGTTTTGAALAIAQHTTKLPISVKISGGNFNGIYALHEKNIEENSAEDIAKLSAEITNGTFAAVEAENLNRFIAGGSFAGDPSQYVKDGYYVDQTKDDSYEVKKISGKLPTGTTVEIDAVSGGTIPEGNIEGMLAQLEDTDLAELNIAKIVDIVLKDTGGTPIHETGKTYAFEIETTFPELAEGYTRKYYVVRYHMAGDGELVVDSWETEYKDGKIIIESNLFSKFAIGYIDTKDIKAPDTGKGAVSATVASSVAAAAAASTLISAAYAVSRAKRQ